MDIMLAILLGILIYMVLCFFIAAIHALFSKAEKKKKNFRETFRTFSLEILNPFHWFA